MGAAVYFAGRHLAPGILNTCILIGMGGGIYFGVLLIFRDAMLKRVLAKFRGRISRKIR